MLGLGGHRRSLMESCMLDPGRVLVTDIYIDHSDERAKAISRSPEQDHKIIVVNTSNSKTGQ